jgi:Glycosyl hydrolase family 12
MRRSASRVLTCSLLLVGFGCVSPMSTTGTGGSSGSGTGASTGNGNSTGSGGSSTGNGGSTGSGGSHTGGSTGTTGGSTGATCSPTDTQFVNASGHYCTTSAVGMQGSIYPYGDGMSCQFSATSAATNICGSSGCCLMGMTKVDSTYAAWGCGIGVELDDDGTTKHVYNGPVTCFNVKLSGSSGGNVVRIAFTQSATPTSGAVAPYTEIPAFTDGWSGPVCFADVTCPGFATTAGTCAKTGTNGTPVDMQIQVAGGDKAGAYNFCLTSLSPMTSGGSGTGGSGGGTSSCTQPSGSGSLSDQYGTAHVMCPKDYIVQNNDWGVSSASQTITYGPGTKFKVTNQGGTGSNGAPASYPDIFVGAHSNLSTANSGLPLAVSSISATGIQTSWSYDDSAVASGSSYNASYDVWFSTGAGGEPTTGAPSGGYLMVWYYKPSDNQPVGQTIANGTATINGKQFNIWYGTNNGKPVVSYVAQQKLTSWTYPLGAFIQDAAGRTCSGSTKCISSSWYLTNVFAGFEIWKGGVGLQTTDFGVSVP